MIKPGRLWHPWAEQITRALEYLAFSEAFGWTPQQVDEMGDEHRQNYVALFKGAELKDG